MSQYQCAICQNHVCREGEDCYHKEDLVQEILEGADPQTLNLIRAAARVEAEGYMQWPRALEIVRFAQRAGFKHLGLAFCIGLADEARIYEDLLEEHFQLSSVCCKVCGLPKEQLGLEQLQPDKPDEVMCSPLAQAALLNEANTDLNISIGLCVGHDALFAAQSQAPVTTLIAKDRVLGHNPVAALYSRYWRRKLRSELG